MSIFARHKKMFSEQEFNKIRDLTVLIAGAGGLGTHQALELQRIGVARIYLVDNDKIELSNLNRQVLYGKRDLHNSKVTSAAVMLDRFDLGTDVVPLEQKIDYDFSIPREVDLVFDALDNYKARSILAKKTKKRCLPFVHGAVEAWSGQVAVIGTTPKINFSDIFPVNNYSGNDNLQAFSPVVAQVASYQVIEGIKVILNRKPNLLDKLLFIDLEYNETNIVTLR